MAHRYELTQQGGAAEALGVVVAIVDPGPQADLTPFAWGYTFEIGGVPAVPDEVEWSHTGDAEVFLDSATADSPTCTPTLPGYVRRSLRVRKDGVDYYAPVSSVRIGDGSALLVYTQDVGDQADFTPVDLVVEVVKGGLTIAPDMVIWVVDESDSGIADAFAAVTTYTPAAVGRHEAVPACLVRDTWYRGAPASFVVGEAFSCTITGIDDQVTLDPVDLAGTVNGGIGVLTYEWSVNGVVVSTAESFSYTPTAVGKHTVTRKVTDSVGQVARCAEEVFQVGDGDFFVTDLDIDFRQAVPLTADGAYTIDGVSITLANLSAATTKECSVANGLYLVHDGTGTPDPQAQINLKTLLANAGHTFDPAAYEYRISWQWEPDTSNVGFGTVVSLNDGAGGAAGERFFVGSSRTNKMMTGGEGTWKDDWAITPQSSMSILVHGHDFDVRYGTKSVDTWDGNTSGMTRFGDTQRSFNARAHLVTTATVTTWDTSALTLIFKVTEATGTGKLYRLWVAHRSRQ